MNGTSGLLAIGSGAPADLLSSKMAPSASPLEQQVDHFIRHPEQLDVALRHLSEQPNFHQALLELLQEFLRRFDDHPAETLQGVSKIMANHSSPFLRSLLEDHPALFVKIIQWLSPSQKHVIMRCITKGIPEWKELLLAIFLSLDQTGEGKEPRDLPRGNFNVNVMAALPSRCQKQWMRYCSREMYYPDWAFWILTLRGQDQKFAFNVSLGSLKMDLSKEGYWDCFESLSQQNRYPHLVKVLITRVLRKFYQAQQFDTIVNQFQRLNLRAQVCLLVALSSSKQECIFQSQRQNLPLLATWMDELFQANPTFPARKLMVSNICEALPEGRLTHFVAALNAKQSKVGAYFLVSLSDDIFQDFLFNVPLTERTTLLLNSVADATSSTLLPAIRSESEQNQMICQVMGLNMENSTVPVDPNAPYTLSQCYELLSQIKSEMANDYTPFIVRIPPVLIGVLAMAVNRRQVIFNLAPYLSEEQFKYVACIVPFPQLCPVIEKLCFSLSRNHFTALHEIFFSTEKLSSYVVRKIAQLKDMYRVCVDSNVALQRALGQAGKDKLVTPAELEQLQKQASDLHALARRPAMMDYSLLRKFLQSNRAQGVDTLQQITQEFEDIAQQLSHHLQLFEGPHASIRNRLTELESAVSVEGEEVDLTSTLYEGFWTLVREGTLPYLGISPHSSLGITHPGQLTYLGIQSDQDREILGISAQLQGQVEALFFEVKEGLQSQGTKRAKVEQEGQQKIWNQFFNIRIPENQVLPLCQEILKTLNIHQIEPDTLKRICLSLYGQLQRFKYVAEEERLSLARGTQDLADKQEPQMIMEIASLLLEEGLFILRNQHPIFCLQRYLLKNSNLKQAWEKLRQHGCASLQALVARELVKTPADLLRLEAIANEMKD